MANVKAGKKRAHKPTGRFSGGRTEFVGSHLTPRTKAWLRGEADERQSSASEIVADVLDGLSTLGPDWKDALKALVEVFPRYKALAEKRGGPDAVALLSDSLEGRAYTMEQSA